MDCWMSGTVRCCSNNMGRQESEGISVLSCSVAPRRQPKRLTFLHHATISDSEKCKFSRSYPNYYLHHRKVVRRALASPTSLESEDSVEREQISSENDSISHEFPEKSTSQLLGTDELKSLLADSERRRLVQKLSEANQQNRYLKRQLQTKDDDLDNLKCDLALLELELQTLVGLAEEFANSGAVTRKINGKYIQSHLFTRLEAVSNKLKTHVKEVDLLKFQEITLSWIGVAECVRVMGSFDGWSEGEHMSPEYDGSCVKFSTTLKLRPGRYEIKFLVDGEWHLSPELPTVGEGLMENNLLVV